MKKVTLGQFSDWLSNYVEKKEHILSLGAQLCSDFFIKDTNLFQETNNEEALQYFVKNYVEVKPFKIIVEA